MRSVVIINLLTISLLNSLWLGLSRCIRHPNIIYVAVDSATASTQYCPHNSQQNAHVILISCVITSDNKFASRAPVIIKNEWIAFIKNRWKNNFVEIVFLINKEYYKENCYQFVKANWAWTFPRNWAQWLKRSF